MKTFLYILITLSKNFFAFFAGVTISITVLLLFIAKPLSNTTLQHADTGTVFYALVVIVAYLMLFGVAGGIIGIIEYNATKALAAKKQPNNNRPAI